ncbi:copper amine oxidase N-terminal domain-containing protein [Paenibacillus caui]|uniref:copper amine oxidase N-terminal domain-containing protein n=1 Tax=Paenibacillus caui TaxID=2873927 RepID=UPI001CA8D23D|nr:copper amine oxidase N-terminal domain-containing protein [Paenibacillus caui]
MRRAGLLLALLLFAMTWMPGAASAAPLPLRVELNGVRIYFPDEQPFADKAQRVQVPVRFVSEALGADVGWTGATKTVTVKLDDNVITLVLGQKEYDTNGQKQQMDTAAHRVGGRTFVPLRFVSEALGAYVKWDSKVRTVYISMTPFESENSQKEPDQNKVVEENIYGFIVKRNTGSHLDIDKGLGLEGYGILQFLIIFPDIIRGADYEMQVQEVEEILSQKVEKETVQAVINYIRKKTTSEPELPMKTFTDKNYEIMVGADINSPIDVTVFEK